MKKTLSLIIVICFMAQDISFALAPESAFSQHYEIQNERVVVKLIETAIENNGIIDKGSILINGIAAILHHNEEWFKSSGIHFKVDPGEVLIRLRSGSVLRYFDHTALAPYAGSEIEVLGAVSKQFIFENPASTRNAYFGMAPSASLRLDLPAGTDPDEEYNALVKINDFIMSNRDILSKKESFVEGVLNELAFNVMEHGKGGTLEARIDSGRLTIISKDNGPGLRVTPDELLNRSLAILKKARENIAQKNSEETADSGVDRGHGFARIAFDPDSVTIEYGGRRFVRDNNSRIGRFVESGNTDVTSGARFTLGFLLGSDTLDVIKTADQKARSVGTAIDGILDPVYTEDDMSVKSIVNPNDDNIRAVYGGAGTDISNFLLSTNAAEGAFIARYKGLKQSDLERGRSLLASFRKNLPMNANYVVEKRRAGYAANTGVGWGIRDIVEQAVFELAFLGIDDFTVRTDDNGRPEIVFMWAYPGQASKTRVIVFVDEDVTDPAKYTDILKKPIDIYYQRAAENIPGDYTKGDCFINKIADSMREGGYFITDDYTTAVGYLRNPAPFPLGLSEVPVPGREERIGPVYKLRYRPAFNEGEGPDSLWFHYGWRVTVRQKVNAGGTTLQPQAQDENGKVSPDNIAPNTPIDYLEPESSAISSVSPAHDIVQSFAGNVPEEAERQAENIRVLKEIYALKEKDLQYGVRSGVIPAADKPFFEVLFALFKDGGIDHRVASRIAHILVRMRIGSLEVIRITGMINQKEKEIFALRDIARFNNMLSVEEKNALCARMKDLSASYAKELPVSKRDVMLKRLIPINVIRTLAKDNGMDDNGAEEAIIMHPDFHIWLPKAKIKADGMKDRVGGISIAWRIVIGHGIDNTDAWVERACAKVEHIKGLVGGSSNAWSIVMNQGIEKTDIWIENAELIVDRIKDKVGGVSNAWSIIIAYGSGNAEKWVKNAEIKVNRIKDMVGGSANAWRIITSQGLKDTDVWVDRACGIVDKIKEQVGGTSHAWLIVMGQGLENAEVWVKKAGKKADEIKDEVGGSSVAWLLVIGQGIDKIDDWMQRARLKVDRIKDRVGNIYRAWRIISHYGLDRTDVWVEQASVVVEKIRDKVGGATNAWLIVIAHGLDDTEGWVKIAEAKVGEIKDKVGGIAKAWFIVRCQGVESTDAWVERACVIVDRIKERVSGASNAWTIVISQGLDNTEEWVKRAGEKVDRVKDKVGGASIAWIIARGQGIDKMEDWIKKADLKVEQIKGRVGRNAHAWQILIHYGLDGADEWVGSASVVVDRIKDEVGGSANAWSLVISHGLEGIDVWIEKARPGVDKIKEDAGGLSTAWLTIINQGVEDISETENLKPGVEIEERPKFAGDVPEEAERQAETMRSMEIRTGEAFKRFSAVCRANMILIRECADKKQFRNISRYIHGVYSSANIEFNDPKFKHTIDDSLQDLIAIDLMVTMKIVDGGSIAKILDDMEVVLGEFEKLAAAGRLLEAEKAVISSGVIDAGRVIGPAENITPQVEAEARPKLAGDVPEEAVKQAERLRAPVENSRVFPARDVVQSFEAADSECRIDLKTRPVADDERILLSESLFTDGTDRQELDKIILALAPILNKPGSHIEILKEEDIVRQLRIINGKSSKDKIAVVLSQEDLDNNPYWKNPDKTESVKATVLFAGTKLTGANYLYFTGLIGFTRAVMAENKDRVAMYYKLLTGDEIKGDVLKLLDVAGSNNTIPFALKLIFKFRPIEKIDPAKFDALRIAMENFLISA